MIICKQIEKFQISIVFFFHFGLNITVIVSNEALYKKKMRRAHLVHISVAVSCFQIQNYLSFIIVGWYEWIFLNIFLWTKREKNEINSLKKWEQLWKWDKITNDTRRFWQNYHILFFGSTILASFFLFLVLISSVSTLNWKRMAPKLFVIRVCAKQ